MRRLAVLPLLAALLLAGCGSSTSSAAPVASGSAAPGVASEAPVGSAPAAGGPSATAVASDAAASAGTSAAPAASTKPAASPVVACGPLNDAIGTIDLYLQLLSQVDASSWGELTGPSSPVGFDRAKFILAIKTLAAVPDTEAAVTSLKEVDRVLGVALADTAPFTSGSKVGLQLVGLVNRGFVPIENALVAARASQGCQA